jgi:uncharacterized membrane protein required for colicin V production
VNWLDFLLIAVLILCAFAGVRFGLIAAGLSALGAFVGWVLAGQWSGEVGQLFEETISNDTAVMAISYGIIILGSLLVAGLAAKILRPLLATLTLGLSRLVDRLGGLALGLLFGAAVAGAIIIGLARLIYNFDASVITDAIPVEVASQAPQVQEHLGKVEHLKQALEVALTESQLVPIFFDIRDTLPAEALGFVPPDFKMAMDILEVNIVD